VIAYRDPGQSPVSERLRVLMLMAAIPYPPIWGSGQRNYELLRYLSRHHDITLLTYQTSTDPDAVDVLSRSARVIYVPAPPDDDVAKRRRQLGSLASPHSFHAGSLYSPALQRALDRALADEPYDVIQIAQSRLSRLRIDAGAALVVLDEHNIEFETLQRSAAVERSPARKLYYYGEYLKHRAEEIAAWRAAAGCTVTSVREEQILHAHVPEKPTAVVMNSVDTGYFRPSGAQTDPDELVFTGLMRYRPNVDAVCHFVRSTLPLIQRVRPNTRLTIVGAGPSPEVLRLAGPDVRVTGSVPDVRPFLARAAVVVVPIRAGGGTRFKIAEGLAMGKAVVSTTIGAEGIGVRHGEHLLLADDPAAFAEEVVRALEDRTLAQLLGAAGRRFAERHLSWDAAGGRLHSFYGELRRGRITASHPPLSVAVGDTSRR
jgi:glycosyltransferase involved in cell wall biosynthesis